MVEDSLSAMRLAPFTHSVALLGANLGAGRAEELAARSYDYKTIYLSLDKDATLSSLKQQREYAKIVKLTVLPLQKDIKDMTQEEFDYYLAAL